MNFFSKLFSKPKPQVFPNIFAARVEKIEKHPNADRLRIITLNLGDRTITPVICGAWNFSEGAIVALALPGAHIPQNIHSETHEPFILGKATIRGVESNGMICAAFELALAPEPGEPAIMILKDNTLLGSLFSPEMLK